MTTIRIGAAALIALALSNGLVLPVAAHVDPYDTTHTHVDVGVTGSGSGSASGSGSGVSGSAGVNANVDVNVGVGGSASSSSSGSGGSGSGSVSGDADVSVDSNGTISAGPLLITRADVDSNAVQSTSVSVGEVKSDADLTGYVAAQIKSDKNISQVETSAENVAVTYNQHAKLFGFIPVKVKATAMVDADGNVSVKYPWWSFLASTDKADLEAKLQASVNAMLQANEDGAQLAASADAAAELSSDAQARLVSAIREVMESEFEASASGNVNADASAQASN